MKKFIALLLALVMVLSLAACAGGNTDDNTDEKKAPPTFTYLYNEGDSHKAIGEYLQGVLASVGITMNMENQDGIDIRNGCHHITVSDITGETGDDVITLTAIVPNVETYRPGGSLRSTHVMHNDWSRRERDIHDITIRNITAFSYL